jgi:serine protease AprX
MPVRRIGWAIAVATLGVVAPASAAAATATPTRTMAPAVTSVSSGRLIHEVLSLRPGTPMPLRAPGLHVLDSLPHVDAELVSASPAALAALRGDPRVAGFSPDWRGHVTGDDSDVTDPNGVLAPQVLGGEAGQPGTGAGVTVALLDTGVDNTPALDRASGRLIDGVDVSTLSAGGQSSEVGPFTDGYGHGTFMASLIAGGQVPGSGPTAIGVAPAAHVVVVKVADADGNTSLLEVLAGLDWVATHANSIQVVNLSLAVDSPTAPAYGADPLTAAVENVTAAGVLVVASAGNTAGQVGDPGIDPQVLTVGAADTSGWRPHLASFSGSGLIDGVTKPDLVAPGAHVLGVESPDTEIAQDNPSALDSDGLFVGSGTSEATAVTSGVAAAYLSDNPGSSPEQVKTALRTESQNMPGWRSGAGLVTVPGALPRAPQTLSDPTGEANFDADTWQANSWLGGAWVNWLASNWSTGAWSPGSWTAGSWSAGSWSASSWSAGSWSAGSWSGDEWGIHQ